MLALLTALVVSAAPPSRAEILDMMAVQPNGFCATGNAWANFLFLEHAPQTNALLRQMLDDETLSADQRRHAFIALERQFKDAATVKFLAARYPTTTPGSTERWVCASVLLDSTPENRELIVKELGAGDERLDGLILRGLINDDGRVRSTPAVAERVAAFYRQTKHAEHQREAATLLARLTPEAFVAERLRAKDAAEIDALAREVPLSTPIDAFLEALSVARPFGREALETQLMHKLKAQLREKKPDPEGDALVSELLGQKARAGLRRAPGLTYLLGTWLEGRGELKTAEALYERCRADAGTAGAQLDAANTDRPWMKDSEGVRSTALACRAQLVSLLLKTRRVAAARALAKGLTQALRDDDEARVVLENDTVGWGVNIATTAWQLEEKARKATP